MKINLSLKYWLSHRSRAFSVILAVAVAMAALTCTAFLVRGASQTKLEGTISVCMLSDFTLIDVDGEMLEKYQNDERIDESAFFYRDGKIKISGMEDVVFGAMTEEGAPLYHFPFEVGDYPEKSGEIAVTRTMLEALGYPVGVGMTINVDLYDLEDNFIGNREFTVCGVFKDQSDYYFDPINRTYKNPKPFVLDINKFYIGPLAFLYPDELSQNAKTDLMLVCAKSENYYSLKDEFNKNDIDYIISYKNSQIGIITNAGYEDTEDEMLESLKYSRPDEYTRTLIPVFTAVTMIVAFVSIFSVISTSLAERRRQLSMLRCIGMPKKKALLMMLSEALVIVATGLAAGFALGVGAYLAVFFVQKNILGLETFLAFSVHPAVASVTVSPYILPLVSCFFCGFFAIFLPSLAELRRSPVEGLRNKSDKKRKARFKFKNKTLLIGKISGGLLQNLTYYIIVIAVVWTGVFGGAYFNAQAKSKTRNLKLTLENDLHGVDYFADRTNFFSLGIAQLNRHFLGIAPEDAEAVVNAPEVEKALRVIEIKSTKVIFERGSLDEEAEKAIASFSLEKKINSFGEDYYNKTLEYWGYAENEVLYNIPTVAIPTDVFEELSEYLVAGEINADKLRSGEEILVVTRGDSEPFSVGDSISLTDVVIEEEAFEEYDFSTGTFPENAEPVLYYNYKDGENDVALPLYAFGKRRDITVTVGGILEFNDDPKVGIFKTMGLISSGKFQFICDENMVAAWGLPDRNYTKLGVKLKENADSNEFEKTWYAAIRSSQSVKSNSLAKILREINNKKNANASVFFAVIVTVVILGLVGIVNSANLRVRKGLRSYSTARALGLSKNKLTGIIMRQGVVCAFVGAVSSLIPIAAFELIKRLADRLTENHGEMVMYEIGPWDWKWYHFFPRYIELWKQPLYFIIPMVFAAVCAVILISNMIPARWIARKNITEALRNDDF